MSAIPSLTFQDLAHPVIYRIRRVTFQLARNRISLLFIKRPRLELKSGQKRIPENKDKHTFTADIFHAQIDRLTGTTGSGGQLYSFTETFFNEKDYGYISIYFKSDEEWVSKLKKYFELLGQFGFGKRKSVGKGAFEVLDVEPFDLFDNIKGNAFISLSNFVPAQDDPVNGHYKIMVKYGKLGGGWANTGNPFKHPLIMFQAGSVFKTGINPKPYYGRMVTDIAPGKPEACQYGYAFAVPAVLGE